MRMANSGNLRTMIKANSYRTAPGGQAPTSPATSGSGRVGSGRLGSGRLMRKNNVIKGVRHVVKGQHPFAFQFDVYVHHIDNLTTRDCVCVVWQRSKETESTRAVQVDQSTNRATFNETMSKEVKLFKESPEDAAFLQKIFKFAVRASGSQGPTIAKIHVDFADYGSLTGFSKKVSFKLSNGSEMLATISCMLTTGSNSPLSVQVASDDQTSHASDTDNFDDLSDSDTTEVDLPTGAAPVRGSNVGPRRVSDGNLAAKGKIEAIDSGNRKAALLQKKMVSQQKRIKDLESQNAILMEELSAIENAPIQGKRWGRKSAVTAAPGGNALQSVTNEVQHLRSEVDRLQDLVAREPEFETLVVELKDVKMTLAMVNLEKEQAKLDLMNYRKESGNGKKKKKKRRS